MPIGAASSVVRHYVTTLTERTETGRARHAWRGGRRVRCGQRRLLLSRHCPRTSTVGHCPGWSWDDVLPHFRAIENDLDFDGPLHGSDGPIIVRRVAEFDGCTASFVDAATEMGYAWVPDLNGAAPGAPLPPGVGAVPLNIDGGTRVGPGGAYLQPALGRPNLTLVSDTRVGTDPDGQRPGGRRGLPRTWRPCLPYCGSDCAVRRGNWVGASFAAVRHRPRGRALRGRHSGCAESAGWRADQRPPRMGGSGDLDAVARSPTGGGDTHHAQRSGDQAVHPGVRRDWWTAPATIRPTNRTSALCCRSRGHGAGSALSPRTPMCRRSSNIATTATRMMWRC